LIEEEKLAAKTAVLIFTDVSINFYQRYYLITALAGQVIAIQVNSQPQQEV